MTPICGPQAASVAHRIEPEDAHRSRVGPAVALEDLDRRGLARAVGTEQTEHLAGAHLEVELVDRAGRAVRLARARRRRLRDRLRCTGSGVPPRDVGRELVEPGRARSRRAAPPRARRVTRSRAGRSRPRRRRARRCARRAPGARRRRTRSRSAEPSWPSSSRSRSVGAGAGDRDERRRLALAQVVAHRLAGHRGLAERAEDVVAELERLAHRQPDRRERRRRARRSGRRARRRGAAAARRCTSPTCTSRCGGRSSASVRAVAVPTRSSDWPTHSSMRSSSKIVCAASGAPRSKMSAYTSAKSPTRIAMPSPNRRAGPRHDSSSCRRANWRCTASRPRRISEPSMMSSCTSANVCTSSSAAAASTTALVVERAARADERARAERGAQSLAARGDEVAQRVERIAERRVDFDPALLLGREQRVDARLDAVGDRIERFGKGRSARRRRGHGREATSRAGCSPVSIRSARSLPARGRVPVGRVDRGAGARVPAPSPATAERVADRLVVEPVVRRRARPGRGALPHRVRRRRRARSRRRRPTRRPADVCLETDYATAVALARGEMNAQAALADGRLRVSGDVARLAAHAAALARLDDVFAAVRARHDVSGPSEPPVVGCVRCPVTGCASSPSRPDPMWGEVTPAERLRAVTRRRVDEDRLAIEAADALAGFASEPASLVVACRRVLAHHRSCGPLWWVCSRILAAADPAMGAHEASRLLETDRTADRLGRDVAVARRRPGRRGGRLARSGRSRDDRAARRRARSRCASKAPIPRPRCGAAASERGVRIVDPWDPLLTDVPRFLVAAAAIGPEQCLVPAGTADALDTLGTAVREVWVVGGVGRVLPARALRRRAPGDVRGRRRASATTRRRWRSSPIARVDCIAGPRGVQRATDAAARSDCPVVPELLRPLD